MLLNLSGMFQPYLQLFHNFQISAAKFHNPKFKKEFIIFILRCSLDYLFGITHDKHLFQFLDVFFVYYWYNEFEFIYPSAEITDFFYLNQTLISNSPNTRHNI